MKRHVDNDFDDESFQLALEITSPTSSTVVSESPAPTDYLILAEINYIAICTSSGPVGI